MPVVKKRNYQTETRLLLESGDPVELPAAEISESSVLLQFEKFKPFVNELLEVLRSGTIAEPVPVMLDGSTFAIHGANGYSNDYPVERYLRNCKAAIIYEGTRDIHTLMQADWALGLKKEKAARKSLPKWTR